ncbi:Fibroblast growth factor-binding protein 1 [Myotis brandtii]|uniref:Fibroblast growth factor-binding protein 1 n=1 Tax=Myotis brandtii TaxID=109478 RepID=S7ND64_MYOBR|nr:PREDICTED: fibroblast growth factor-binding protein 1 [Myotis brandtii]XP_014404827.1 PREDICTED: fibroblast growth factor-binding protein 1 [Myotis brandtii]EPQ15096.1 Fibroblast growth factor-binding protein 1 [Myotis brandtii]
MRIHSLTLLSFLLLAAQVFLVESKKEVKKRGGSKATTEKTQTLGKPWNEQRSQPPKHLTKGKFVTQDQADCRWVVTEKEEGIVLKVDCTRQDNKFSCSFTGNPTSCLESTKKGAYWKQIGRSLRTQKVICGDSKSILKTRVCRKKFPESNLKLVNSTLIGKKPSQETMEPSPREQTMTNEASLMEPNKVKENTLAGPAESSINPECLEDPDMMNQKKAALEYCGESWSSFCKFFFTMVQSESC